MTKLAIACGSLAVLDGGDVTETEDGFIIEPPNRPMIDQLVAYLDEMPYKYIGVETQRLGIGMTAICVRWGSYLATLLDETALVHPDLKGANKQQLARLNFITDSEMKRLNIEISYNLFRLVQLYRERGLDDLEVLLAKAYLHLPMPQRTVQRDRKLGYQLVESLRLVASLGSARNTLPDHHTAVVPTEHADRTIANVLSLWGWRNTEIESIHAGAAPPNPLHPHQQRMLPRQARHLIRVISSKFASHYFWFETFFGNTPLSPDLPAWPETATTLVHSFLGMQASSWSLTDSSSTVRLPK